MLTPGVRLSASLFAALLLAGCKAAPTDHDPGEPVAQIAEDLTDSDDAAIVRFLSHATFGATPDAIARVRSLGYGAWLKGQLSARLERHLPYVSSVVPPTNEPGAPPKPEVIIDSVWTGMALGDDQVRQRLAYAYSQIFVVSLNATQIARRPAGVASFYDLLGVHAVGNYRNMLGAVSRSPVMGIYLSSLKNEKADAATGRAPDENYAREVMQLFSIGLYELNLDGTPKLDGGGRPIETYGTEDVVGLARVFTGYSWACVDGNVTAACFRGGAGTEPMRDVLPMQLYPDRHSPEATAFLGLPLPAEWTGQRRLERALDHLAQHDNVAQFIGKQLIQRLVTSNPSPAYVGRVSRAFVTGSYAYDGEPPTVSFGDGKRGNLEAVAAAVLLDPEAMNPGRTEKLDEPVLRFMRWARAFGARPDPAVADGMLRLADISGRSALGQAPLRSPSVFNFYRPGFTPPNTGIAAAGKAAPEFQITDEVSVAGYANFMLETVGAGVALRDRDPDGKAYRFAARYEAELELAATPVALVNRVDLMLTGQRMKPATRSTIASAVRSITIPQDPRAAQIAKRDRVSLAVYLGTISTEFLVH